MRSEAALDEYITTEEAARRLKVTPQTVVRYIKDGKLIAAKVGKSFRIRGADVALLLGLAPIISPRGAVEIIALVNPQGGAGKTTAAINLAAALGGERLGKRVLLVDLDPQGDCARVLGLEVGAGETVYNALSGAVPLARVIHKTDFGFDLAPAALDLAVLELDLGRRLGGELLLRRRLEPLLDRYDVILLDCPPSLGVLTTNALAAAERVIMPVAGESASIRTLELLADAVELIKNTVNQFLHLTGVLVTQYRAGTQSERAALAALDEYCHVAGVRLFAPSIKHSPRLAESSAALKPFVLLAPTEDAAQAYTQLAQAIYGDGNAVEVAPGAHDGVAPGRVAVQRRPIRKRRARPTTRPASTATGSSTGGS